MYKNLMVGVVLAGALSLPAAAASSGSSTTCYNCKNPGGTWNCDTFGSKGGLSCTVGQDSCTVKGKCDLTGSSGLVAMDVTIIEQVAQVHPRVAATLLELTKTSQVADTASVFWSAAPMGPEQVALLLAGGPAGLEQTPGEAVVYEAYLETHPSGAALIIVPTLEFAEDPIFTEFRLELELSNGVFVPTSWTLQ